MKIIIVSRQYYPYGMASVNRLHCYTQGFTELGIETSVIIPEATIPFKEKDVTLNKKHEGVYKNTYFRYMSGTTIRDKKKWKRPFLDIISRIKTVLYILKKTDKNTVLYIWGGGVVWTPIMLLCGNIKKANVYTELNELPYGTGKECRKTRFLRYIMLRYIFPHYDGFIVISEELKKIVQYYNKKKQCVLKVPILVDSDINSNIPILENKKPFIFHSGTLTEQKDGIIKMLTAFAIAKQKINDLEFYLTGILEKSSDAAKIKETIKKYNIEDSVHFLGYISKEALLSYQKSCTLMIIYKYDTLQNKYCFSTKLGEYLALGKPVIITNIGEANYYMKDKLNALVVDWRDIEGVADNIVKIVLDPKLGSKIGLAGQKTCKCEFNYLVHARKMIDFFQQKIK